MPSPECPGGGFFVDNAAVAKESYLPAAMLNFMTNLMSILSTGNANIKLEITGDDLLRFSEDLISRAVNEVAAAMRASQGESLLTKEKVKQLCGVCDATLWHWDKRSYLKPVRVGAKVMYRNSDVRRILGERTQTIGDDGKK